MEIILLEWWFCCHWNTLQNSLIVFKHRSTTILVSATVNRNMTLLCPGLIISLAPGMSICSIASIFRF